MTTVRVGFNKIWGILMLALAGLQFFTYSLTAKQMYVVLALLWALIGVMFLVGTCFVVEIHATGGGEVQMKNPLGMTLKRHPFATLADLRVTGSKLWVTRTDGQEKGVGGLNADGADMKKLAATIEQLAARPAP